MSKYCLSAECTEDNLATIRIRVFGKDFVCNIIEILPFQTIIDLGLEIGTRLIKRQPLRIFIWGDDLKWGIESREISNPRIN
jgi:hypothetical protein